MQDVRMVVIHAGPRQEGSADRMAQCFLNSFDDRCRMCVEHIRVFEKSILPCTSCFSCESSGVCVIQDDMQQYYDRLDSADIIVVASPIFFHGVPSSFKAFIDRCQPFYVRKYCLKRQMKKKTGVFLACCDNEMGSPFAGAEQTIRAWYHCLDATLEGVFYCVLGGQPFALLPDEHDRMEKMVEHIMSKGIFS